MELNEMEKKLLFQVEGDYQTKILNELYMTVRYSNNSEQREAAEGLMAKLRVLSNAECMDLVKDIQKNYRLPYPARTIGEKIAEARQQSGAEKLKGHDIMALERFDPEVKHMIVFDVLSYDSPVGDKGDKMRFRRFVCLLFYGGSLSNDLNNGVYRSEGFPVSYGSQRGRSLVRRCPDDGFRHAATGYKKKYPLSLRRQYRTQRWFSGYGQPERMD